MGERLAALKDCAQRIRRDNWWPKSKESHVAIEERRASFEVVQSLGFEARPADAFVALKYGEWQFAKKGRPVTLKSGRFGCRPRVGDVVETNWLACDEIDAIGEVLVVRDDWCRLRLRGSMGTEIVKQPLAMVRPTTKKVPRLLKRLDLEISKFEPVVVQRKVLRLEARLALLTTTTYGTSAWGGRKLIRGNGFIVRRGRLVENTAADSWALSRDDGIKFEKVKCAVRITFSDGVSYLRRKADVEWLDEVELVHFCEEQIHALSSEDEHTAVWRGVVGRPRRAVTVRKSGSALRIGSTLRRLLPTGLGPEEQKKFVEKFAQESAIGPSAVSQPRRRQLHRVMQSRSQFTDAPQSEPIKESGTVNAAERSEQWERKVARGVLLAEKYPKHLCVMPPRCVKVIGHDVLSKDDQRRLQRKINACRATFRLVNSRQTAMRAIETYFPRALSPVETARLFVRHARYCPAQSQPEHFESYHPWLATTCYMAKHDLRSARRTCPAEWHKLLATPARKLKDQSRHPAQQATSFRAIPSCTSGGPAQAQQAEDCTYEYITDEEEDMDDDTVLCTLEIAQQGASWSLRKEDILRKGFEETLQEQTEPRIRDALRRTAIKVCAERRAELESSIDKLRNQIAESREASVSVLSTKVKATAKAYAVIFVEECERRPKPSEDMVELARSIIDLVWYKADNLRLETIHRVLENDPEFGDFGAKLKAHATERFFASSNVALDATIIAHLLRAFDDDLPTLTWEAGVTKRKKAPYQWASESFGIPGPMELGGSWPASEFDYLLPEWSLHVQIWTNDVFKRCLGEATISCAAFLKALKGVASSIEIPLKPRVSSNGAELKRIQRSNATVCLSLSPPMAWSNQAKVDALLESEDCVLIRRVLGDIPSASTTEPADDGGNVKFAHVSRGLAATPPQP